MNCVVTGGTGLIGRRIIRRLLNAGGSVISFVHSKSEMDMERDKNHLRYVHDFSKSQQIIINPSSQPIDAVIHLVQSNRYKDFPGSANDIFYTNLDSTFKMLEFARENGVKNFILASSGGIYGAGLNAFKEYEARIKYENLGFYLNTKMCAEILAENYKRFMNVIVLRFFFVYGEMQKDVMLLPRLAMSISSGKPIILHGANGININPIYVDDAANAIVRALSLNNSYCINIAGCEIVCLKELSVMLGNLIHKKPVFIIDENEALHFVADIEQMKALLGEPKIMLSEGLDRMIHSMRERGVISD